MRTPETSEAVRAGTQTASMNPNHYEGKFPMKMDQDRPEINLPVLGGSGAPLTMSSREIAELVEKRHDNVKRTVDTLVERRVIARPHVEDVAESATTPTGGRRTYTTSVYHLEKRDSFVVVAQLSPEFTARLVDRWQQLEEEKRSGGFALPQSYEQALEGLLAKVRENSVLMVENRQKDAVIGEMQPKADAYDVYLSEEAVVPVMCFCNKHGVKKNHPGYVLRDKGLLHQKKLIATQTGLQSGIIKNVIARDNFEYIDSKGQSVEAQTAMIVKQREISLLKMLIDAYGMTAFRNRVAFDRAKNLIGGA